MNRGRITRTALILTALILMLAWTAGCGGKKAEVETDPTLGMDETPAETVPTPVVPEEPAEPTQTVVDYAGMDPADYGVEDVFFAFDQYDLDTETMGILSANARILRETGATVLISGHCDERGTIEYNLALGEKRALAVRDYLISLGVSASQLRATSYGESRPFASGSNEDAWAQNRRAHFERP